MPVQLLVAVRHWLLPVAEAVAEAGLTKLRGALGEV